MVRRTNKFRGSRTHGRGKKAGRGAGKRGGRGNAGIHKHRRIWMKKQGIVWGVHGFNKDPSTIKRNRTINLWEIEKDLDAWVSEKKAKKIGNNYEIDLGKLGYNKLLGAGKLTKSVSITVEKSSEKAMEKVKSAGGKVTTISK